MSVLLLLLLLGLSLWLWQAHQRAWERAREASTRACRRCGVQLLDDTVALNRLRLRRSGTGLLGVERIYTFEYTDTGATRRTGRVITMGGQVEVLTMEDEDLLIP